MREILFRGKRLDNGKWIEGRVFRLSEDLPPLIMLINRHGEAHEVDPETVGQYTGLTDKNGKKIFEGDILEYRSFSANGAEEVKHAVVFWDEHRWSRRVFYNNRWINCWKGNDICDIYRHIVAKFGEVIGNIHDNSELLGGADNG